MDERYGVLDPQADEALELQDDALNDGGASECASAFDSRFSLASRVSTQSQRPTSQVTRRRGRSDATPMKQPAPRQREGSVGSPSPVDSFASSPTRSMRSVSTAPPSIDPRGDHELLQLMDVGDPLEFTCLDLSLAAKKTKKALKSFQSLADFVNLTELNVANNALASLDGVDVFTELVVLTSSRNHLKRIDASLFSLVSLQSLDLSGNFISHIPRGIAALEVLEVLNLSGNNLSALKEIDVLGKLANLHMCNLAANPFCKLPTYKDYAVSKLLSLERLDDAVVTDQHRDKSRRRFSEEMFSKDKHLRDVDMAHASEQSKLREAQLVLEAENQKLKDELQLKSKLLQNKSKAWSNATEQLLQLQQDLAMMNLDRRHGTAVPVDTNNFASLPAESDPTSNQPALTVQVPSDAGPRTSPSSRQSSPPRQSTRPPPVSNHDEQNSRQRSCGTSPVRISRHEIRGCSPTKGALVDAACSPFFAPANQVESKFRSVVDSGSGKLSPKTRSPLQATMTEDQQHTVMTDDQQLEMFSPHDYASRLHQRMPQHDPGDGDDGGDEPAQMRQSLRFPAFEDDSGCPAYDDSGTMMPTETRESRNQQPVASPQRMSRAIVDVLSPLQSPRAHRMWERQRVQLVQETSKGSPNKVQRQSQVMGLVEKENLVRQIQALQSCKQSVLAEIAKEEQLVHDLKRESSTYANQIERLESDMQILVGTTGQRSGTTNQQREEETVRAKLEMLRNKLHYAEDKEGEIEATIVRMTKRVLEEDLQNAQAYGRSSFSSQAPQGHFDKEIFALTHNLQLVIVEKEEIHSEMSRLMNQLRGASPNDRSVQQSTGLSAEALLLIDQHDQLQRVSAENQAMFVEKQKKVDEFKRKLRDVHDRINIKEDLLASLVSELKDVESELAYIDELTPKTPGTHRRSLSLDSVSSSVGDIPPADTTTSSIFSLRTNGAPTERSKSPNQRNSLSSPKKAAKTHESISNMVEAAAADVNTQFEQKFKELFSPEVLESIKLDIYDKLSRQFKSSSSSSGATAKEDQLDLHAAIAAALDVHMKRAVESFETQRDEGCQEESKNSPIKPNGHRGSASTSQPADLDGFLESANDRRHEQQCWDEVDDFMPIPEATYAAKYRFLKEVGALSPGVNGKCLRTASAHRLQKAGERLEQAEAECRIDTFSGIETDGSGKKKSDLKVVIMGARDLPTSHLRTKNLDPYVAVEIVYPQHVRPQAQPTSLRARPSSALSQGRNTFLDELGQLPNQSFRSRTVKKSVYPIWDEEFEFAPVHSLRGYLRVRVLNDRKLSREQLVGEVKIPLRMLVDQKKVVESFVLSVSGPSGGNIRRNPSTPRTAGHNGSGTIRMQLQLSFSRIEKLKRALDDLVVKHIDEYNQLPPCIERIEEYEARLAAPPVEPGPEDGQDQNDGADACVSASPLPTYESWKAQQPPPASDQETSDPRSSTSNDPDTARATGLSVDRSAALWATPSTARPTETTTKPAHRATASSGGPVRPPNQRDDGVRIGSTTRSTKPTTTSNHNSGKKADTSVSAKAAMAQLRQLVNSNKPTQAATTLQNAGAGFSILHNSGPRRKTVGASMPVATSSSPFSPDCFDDYSPYHPDFQLLDPLGIDGLSTGNSGLQKPRSTSLASRNRTDLRIFKSPGFSRREPSGGFPERFIGLDTQTSERIKRIFGRIDNQA